MISKPPIYNYLKLLKKNLYIILSVMCVSQGILVGKKSKILNYFLGRHTKATPLELEVHRNMHLNHCNAYLIWKMYLGKLILFDFQRTSNDMICLKEKCTKITA